MNRREASWIAQSNGWLSTRPSAFREALMARAAILRCDPGEPPHAASAEPDGLFGVLSGALVCTLATSDLGPVVTHVLHPVTWYGRNAAERAAPVVEMQAMVPSRIAHVPAARLDELARIHPLTWRHVCALAEHGMAAAHGVAAALLIRDVDRRIAATLLRASGAALTGGQTCGDEARPVELRLSQAALGEMANASRHLVNRTLGLFERAEWVSTGYNRVLVRNARALAAFAAGAIGPGRG
jgi:CRP-like cAMP-binding protein